MKVVILAGGFGTRLSEYTETIPKPMVSIGGKPLLWHIMNIYGRANHKDFYLALGYKSEVIKEYFYKYSRFNSNFTINLKDGSLDYHDNKNLNWKVSFINTGLETATGGRIKAISEYVQDEEEFMFTYGDGLSNINITELNVFVKKNILTVAFSFFFRKNTKTKNLKK